MGVPTLELNKFDKKKQDKFDKKKQDKFDKTRQDKCVLAGWQDRTVPMQINAWTW